MLERLKRPLSRDGLFWGGVSVGLVLCGNPRLMAFGFCLALIVLVALRERHPTPKEPSNV